MGSDGTMWESEHMLLTGPEPPDHALYLDSFGI